MAGALAPAHGWVQVHAWCDDVLVHQSLSPCDRGTRAIGLLGPLLSCFYGGADPVCAAPQHSQVHLASFRVLFPREYLLVRALAACTATCILESGCTHR